MFSEQSRNRQRPGQETLFSMSSVVCARHGTFAMPIPGLVPARAAECDDVPNRDSS